MAKEITDTVVKGLATPKKGNSITYDTKVKGFGVRVSSGGARSFILNYRTRSGRERRFTIGSYPDWKTSAARNEASTLKKKIDLGADPMAEVQTERGAPTMADLCKRFEEEHLPRKRPKTQADYRAAIEKDIKPAMGSLKVHEVTFSDCDGLHRKITKRDAPYRANRVLAILSKMFNLAIKWRMRADNPTKGVERNLEEKRERYLTTDELKRLATAFAKYEDKQAADIWRLLLLTGARRGEVQSFRWADLDLTAGIWTKPASSTKQKALHRVPLSAPARQLLAELRKNAKKDAEYVFPGRGGQGYREALKDDWTKLCEAANITNARMHDCRHSFASILVSSGSSLPLIGRLLGHANPNTTARYAHLFDDPLKAATERVGAVVTGQPSAEVVPMEKARR